MLNSCALNYYFFLCKANKLAKWYNCVNLYIFFCYLWPSDGWECNFALLIEDSRNESCFASCW